MGLLALLVNVYSAQPDWWAARGVLDVQQVQDQNAAVNVGQLKAMAAKAMDEMDAKLPGGAGPAIHALVKDWRDNKLQHDQSAALNVGQLKAVAKIYYDRLVEVGARPSNAGYPWPVNPLVSDNYALVNAGQVKNVFSFAIPLINDTDTDADGMPDGWELTNGLNPALDDSLEDNDGDRVPNLFEYKRGTVANDSNSTPVATFVVNPDLGALDTTDNVYSTIKEALDQVTSLVNAYAVIEVKSGVYAELVLVNKAPVLLLGELGNIKGPPVIIGSLTSSAYAVYLSTASVLDGFIIKHTSARSGGGVSVNTGTGSPRRRLVNCVIRGNESSTGGGVYNSGAKLDVVHCTVTGNKGTSSGRGIYNSNASTLNLVNSIVWGNTGSAAQEIYKYPHTSSIVTVTGGSVPAVATSIVAYGEHGGINADPQLTPAGWLWSSAEYPSPAINRVGVAVASASKVDIHGEPRPADGATADLGADEFKDSNADGLPDWLEGPDDADGLAALVEYKIHGTSPLLIDTDGDGVSDDVEISQGSDPFDDFYHAQPPSLKFVGGGNQWGTAGTVLATPISLSVNNGTLNAPVTFTASNGGLISTDGVSNWQSSLSLLSNATYNVPGGAATKVAQFFAKLPEGIGSSSGITASVTTGGKTITASTWVASFDPALPPPTDLIATPTGSDTVRLNWTPGDLTKATTIEFSADNGATWSTAGVAGAGDVYATIKGLPTDKAIIFRGHSGGAATNEVFNGEWILMAQNITATQPSEGIISPSSSPSVAVTPLSKPRLLVEPTSFLGTKWGYLGLIDKTHSYLSQYKVMVNPSGATAGDTREVDPKTGEEKITYIHNTGNFMRDTLAGYMQGYDPGYTDTTGIKTVYGTLGNTSQVNYIEHVQLSKPNTMEDLIKHMEVGIKNVNGDIVESPWVPPFQNNFVQEIKPTPQNQYNEYAPGRASALINITYPTHDAATGWTSYGGYELKKLQYKWQVNSDKKLIVNWFEVFTPYDGTAPIVTPLSWANIDGKTESDVYVIDPTTRNGKKNGVYKVVQVDININDTVATNDDIVRKSQRVETKNYLQWIPCTVKVPTEFKLTRVYITSNAGSLKFSKTGNGFPNNDTEPQVDIELDIDSSGQGRFYITGGFVKSDKIDDAKIEVRKSSAFGEVLASKPMTVFWFSSTKLTIKTGPEMEGTIGAERPVYKPKHPIELHGEAKVSPEGLDIQARQIADWSLGVMQNTQRIWHGQFNAPPTCSAKRSEGDVVMAASKSKLTILNIERYLDAKVIATAGGGLKKAKPGPFMEGEKLSGFFTDPANAAFYDTTDSPQALFPFGQIKREDLKPASSRKLFNVLWPFQQFQIEYTFDNWLVIWKRTTEGEIVPILQGEWKLFAFCDGGEPTGGTYTDTITVEPYRVPIVNGLVGSAAASEYIKHLIDTSGFYDPNRLNATLPWEDIKPDVEASQP